MSELNDAAADCRSAFGEAVAFEVPVRAERQELRPEPGGRCVSLPRVGLHDQVTFQTTIDWLGGCIPVHRWLISSKCLLLLDAAAAGRRQIVAVAAPALCSRSRGISFEMFTTNEVQRTPTAVNEIRMQIVAIEIAAQLVLVHKSTDVRFGCFVKLIGIDAIGEISQDVLRHYLRALTGREEGLPFVNIVIGPHGTQADETSLSDRPLAKTATDPASNHEIRMTCRYAGSAMVVNSYTRVLLDMFATREQKRRRYVHVQICIHKCMWSSFRTPSKDLALAHLPFCRLPRRHRC